MNAVIIGAGVAGLSCACELIDRGLQVDVYEQSDTLGSAACSWFAGGMLAPWCERESAEQVVADWGADAIDWWSRHIDGVQKNGSLVLSMQRDRNELNRFARLTENHQWVDREQIDALEPDLAGRFEHGLLFSEEAHLDPRDALAQLHKYIIRHGGTLHFGEKVTANDFPAARVIDCRGFSAQEQLNNLRGVKGEMLILRSHDISLSRPIRLVHPRYPIYLVPRDDNRFMLGATMIENSERNRISARSMLELLSAAYAVHPAFGEAEIVEIGVDVRPAFADNLPTVCRNDKTLFVNGLYRHGFLLGPAMAQRAADALLNEQHFAELAECA